jgi:hypothetical protein
MDKTLAAEIFSEGEIVEENNIDDRIYSFTIAGRWLYPGEKVIEYKGVRYVVVFPKPVTSKDYS